MTPPLVSLQNDVWGMSTEIPYSWHVTTQSRVVLLFGHATREIRFKPIRSTIQIWVVMHDQNGISAVVPQTSFWGETSGGSQNACFLRLCTLQYKQGWALRKIEGCSETVKSRVPSIWFVWKIWDFLVTRRQKLGARGHRALLEHIPDKHANSSQGLPKFPINKVQWEKL